MLKESVPILIIMGFFTTLNHIMKSRWLNPYIGPSPKDKYGYGHMIGVIIVPLYHTERYPSKLTIEKR